MIIQLEDNIVSTKSKYRNKDNITPHLLSMYICLLLGYKNTSLRLKFEQRQLKLPNSGGTFEYAFYYAFIR